jgi:hypothetical protein
MGILPRTDAGFVLTDAIGYHRHQPEDRGRVVMSETLERFIHERRQLSGATRISIFAVHAQSIMAAMRNVNVKPLLHTVPHIAPLDGR